MVGWGGVAFNICKTQPKTKRKTMKEMAGNQIRGSVLFSLLHYRGRKMAKMKTMTCFLCIKVLKENFGEQLKN